MPLPFYKKKMMQWGIQIEGLKKRSDYERCQASGKVMYPTKSEATKVMSALRNPKRSYQNGKRINRRMGKPAYNRVYFCNDCNSFHITSKPYNKEMERIANT